jgi:putative ATP-binding cassette transporter
MTVFGFVFRHSRGIVISSLVAGGISGAVNAVLLGEINSVLKSRETARVELVWSFFALCVLLAVSRFISEVLLTRLGQNALYELRLQLSGQILAVPLLHLEKLGVHRLLAALTDDVPTIANTILSIPLLAINAAVVIGCLVFMGFLSPVLLVIVIGFMALGVLSYQLPILKAQAAFTRARKDGDAMLEHFRALTHGTKELKLHSQRRRSFLNDILAGTADCFRRNSVAGLTIYTAASSWGQALVFVVIGLVLLVLESHTSRNGMLTGYTLALLYLMTPLQVIMNTLPNLTRASVALNNIKELQIDLEGAASEKVLANDVPAEKWHTLEFASVAHTYSRENEEEPFVLGPINLAFRCNEIVFITGGNGSGKTTFAKLLCGLYVPEAGEIRLDGNPIKDQDRESYRQYFASVFSDFYLFEEFLGLNSEELESKAAHYLEQLLLNQKVWVHNGRLSTIKLSQGQRKRLALLTAYLEDRSIYIFDEWAADQDPYFKEVFYLQLVSELKSRGKTIFVISHDDRFYHLADRIVKFGDGRLISDTRTHPFGEKAEVAR